MKKKKRLLGSALVVVAAFGVILSGGNLLAQQSNGQGLGSGLKISPVRNDVVIDKGKSQTFSLFIENITNKPVIAHPVVNDFQAGNDETGQPKLILDDSKTAPSHSFKQLTPVLPNDVALQPNERKEVKITVSVPSDAAGGGYYGAVRFALLNAPQDNSRTVVGLSASVGSLFLVKVPGDITEQLKVESFDIEHNGKAGTMFNSGPVTAVVRFNNSGNIHLQPFGKIEVKNMFGKAIETEELNNTTPRSNVLPNSVRKFTVDLKKVKGFGRFTATGNFGYGDNGQLLTTTTTFYIIPYALIIVLLVIILLLIFVLPRAIKRYNQRIIAESRHKKK